MCVPSFAQIARIVTLSEGRSCDGGIRPLVRGWRGEKAGSGVTELRGQGAFGGAEGRSSTPQCLHFVKALSEWRCYATVRASRTAKKECGGSSRGASRLFGKKHSLEQAGTIVEASAVRGRAPIESLMTLG